jgi:hypothetical protein
MRSSPGQSRGFLFAAVTQFAADNKSFLAEDILNSIIESFGAMHASI